MRTEIALAKLAAEMPGTGGSKVMPPPKPLGIKPVTPGPAAPKPAPLGQPPQAPAPAMPKPAPTPMGQLPPAPTPARPGPPAPTGPQPPAGQPAPAPAPAPEPAQSSSGIGDGLLGMLHGMKPEQLGQMMAGMAPVTKAVAGIGGLPAIAGLTDMVRGGGHMQTLLAGPNG